MRLEGKTAVVSGGGSGIGKATCLRLAEEGATVAVVDRYLDAARATVELIEQDGKGAAFALECEVSSEDALASTAAACADRFDSLDILVNNAGIRAFGPVVDATLADWDVIYEVNLRAVARLTAVLMPQLTASGNSSVVNVSSINAVVGRAGMGLYDAAKAGVLSLTKTLACEHADDGVRVNAVLPGGTFTEFHRDRAEAAGTPIDETVTVRHEGGPALLKRRGHPREIANAILFLASDESSFFTGTFLLPDGGLSCGSATI